MFGMSSNPFQPDGAALAAADAERDERAFRRCGGRVP